MISWEKGGVAPIYLCESHAAQMGSSMGSSHESSVRVRATMTQPVPSSHPRGQPNRSVSSGGPADAQVGSGKKDLAVIGAPASDPASGDFAKAVVNEPMGSMAREDFEAHGTALKPHSATEVKQAENADLERVCVSRYGERCTCEATVHCPKCQRWFCDAHGEDEKWHHCAFLI